MQIKRIFDLKGPAGFVPNGWNYKYTDDLWNNNFIVTHDFIEKFNKKYIQVPVYDCNLNLPQDVIKDICISDISFNPNEKIVNYQNDDEQSQLFFYTIHPFGSVDTCIGDNLNYHEKTHCFDFISKKSIYYLQNANNYFLIFDYSSEGDIKKSLFDNLHKKCKELEIPPHKVIVITSAMNTRSIYEEHLLDVPEINNFYTGYYCWSLIAKKKETTHLLFENNIFEFNGNRNQNSLMNRNDFISATNRPKKCLILNRRVAPHRVILLSLLQSENLLKDIDYSIDLSLWTHGDLSLDLANGTDYDDNFYITNKELKSKMLHGFFKLKKIGKNTVDYDDINGVWGFGFESKTNYLNSYFSVITETIFYEHGHYISEKTFKGIEHLHPFVIVGKPGILKYLRLKGFKTFSEFWDESYDNEPNNSERIIKIFNLVKSLIQKTNEEWDELNKKLLPILEYNREHLLSFTEEKVGNTYVENLNKLLQYEPNKENYFLF